MLFSFVYQTRAIGSFTSQSPIYTRCYRIYHSVLARRFDPGKTIRYLEIGSGTGNLAETLLNNSQKTLNYMGMEVDDLLIDLSASIAEVVNSVAVYIQGDAVRPHILKESNVIISDLPIGYYPNDEIASRFKVAATGEHTYAHHLLMEQSLKYLKKDGIAIFLAPTNL